MTVFYGAAPGRFQDECKGSGASGISRDRRLRTSGSARLAVLLPAITPCKHYTVVRQRLATSLRYDVVGDDDQLEVGLGLAGLDDAMQRGGLSARSISSERADNDNKPIAIMSR